MLENNIFPNYRGAYIDLVKYGNVREGNPTKEDLMSGVTLMLYEKSGDSWIESASQTTDENGYVRLLLWEAGPMRLPSLQCVRDGRSFRDSGLRERIPPLQKRLFRSTGRQ